MEWVGDGGDLRLQVLVVEEVLRACYIQNLRAKLVQGMLETISCYLEGGSDKLVTVFDGFLEELLVECHDHQSVLWLILGVEQADVHQVVAQLEVVLQYAIIE